MEKYSLTEALIVNGFTLGIILYFLKRWIDKVDERLKVIVGEKLCDERRKEIRSDIEEFCKKNEKEHKALGELWRHKHASSGEVIIP